MPTDSRRLAPAVLDKGAAHRFADMNKRIRTLESIVGYTGTPGGGSGPIDPSTQIPAGSITATMLAPLSVGTVHVQNVAIKAQHIGPTEVNGTHIAANSISTGHIAANTIVANHITANAIQANHIAANQIQAQHIQANTIQASHISAGAVTANAIAANSITSAHITAGAITAGAIAANAILAGDIAAGAVTAGTIAAGAVTATTIAAGAVTATSIAAGTITSTQIQAGSITAASLSSDALTSFVAGANQLYIAGGPSLGSMSLDTSGLKTYSPGGVLQAWIKTADGSVNVYNGTIQGAVIETGGTVVGPVSSNKVMMDSTGLRAFDSSGNTTVTIDTNGQLTVLRGTITLASTVPAGTGARVVLDATGIKAYNASNVQEFLLDATTGLIQCTGIVNATTGSTVPVQTIVGNLPGSANRYSNSNFQDGAGNFSTTGWTITNATASSGGTTEPPVYGQLSMKLVATGHTAPTAPTLALVAAAGNLGVGTYRYVVTYVTVTGETVASAEATVTTVANSQQVTVTIPVAAAPTFSNFMSQVVTARKIYRTAVGGASGTEKLLATVNDNTTTTYADNIADAGLGAAVPTTNTSSDYLMINHSTVTDPYVRAVPGLKYSFSHYIWPTASGKVSTIEVVWYDSTGSPLLQSQCANQTLTANQWNRVTGTAQAPANAAFALGFHFIAEPATAGDTYYVNAFQMEQGDAASAYAPRPDEILYNSINANMIQAGTITATQMNVSQLSAISANLGSVTTGTITGVTITGAVHQTSATNPRTYMDTSGIWVSNSSGGNVVGISSGGGVQIAAGSNYTIGQANSVSFTTTNVGGSVVAAIYGISGGTTNYMYLACGPSGTSSNSSIVMISGSTGGAISIGTKSSGGTAYSATLLDNSGASAFNAMTISNTITVSGNSTLKGIVSVWNEFFPCVWGTGQQSSNYIASSGNYIVTNATSGFSTASDANLKYNIKTLEGEDALRLLRSVRPVRFNWKSNDHRAVGFVAQEVHEYLPEVVGDPVPGHPRFMNQTGLIAPLWAASQQLLQRIERLESLERRMPVNSVVDVASKATTFEEFRTMLVKEHLRRTELEHFNATLVGNELGELTEQVLNLQGELAQLGGPHGQ